MRLNKETVAGLKLPPSKSDKIYWCDQVPGFGCRVRASGKKVWVIQWEVAGVQRRMTLGTVELFSADQARKWAREQLAKVRLGDDPMAKREAERVAAKVTLGSIADLFLKEKQNLRPKSLTELTRYLKVHWAPLHRTPLHLVSQREVAARITEIKQQSGAIAASHARLALSGLYVWAMQQGGMVDRYPVSTPPIPVMAI
jgi:hypothetical protein